jgi:hypothetical protein
LHNLDWSKELDQGLPDCRVRGGGNTVVRAKMLWEKVYCANCGHLSGLVTAEWAAHVFYLCEKCAEVHGKLDLPEVPKDQCRTSS